MDEPWRPFVALLQSFADLLALARQARAVDSTGGSSVDSGPVATVVERFRDASVAASELELLSVRLYHRRRSGFVPRPDPCGSDPRGRLEALSLFRGALPDR